MEQLFFKFPIISEYLSEDFYVSSANNQAFDYINKWPNWSGSSYPKILLIYGEKASGKTHLAHIWQSISKAKIISPESCNHLHSLTHESALILEDIENISEQELLLHLINFSHENQQYLFLTSALPPTKLNFSLPDLSSRILALFSIEIKSPDEELLRTILFKALSERQLQIHIAAIDYINARI